MEEKRCPHCEEIKPTDEFYRRKDGYLSSWCKICNRYWAKRWYKAHPGESARRSKEWREKNPERYAATKGRRREHDRLLEIKRRYGLEPEEYKLLLDKQKGVCATCGSEFKRREPVVDHCHETGDVRGLLCRRCNSVLGYVQDDLGLLEGLRRYVKCHGITSPVS